jgi:aspartate carbamoyltransferase catalytic subunit
MRHLLSIADVSKVEAISILDTAHELARVSEGAVKKLPTLRGRTIVNLFAEDSTRTRISFEAAAKRLSADVINFSAKGSSVSKGESLKDTAMTLQAMGADAVVIRHSASGAAQRLADSQWMSGSVVNAGDGTHEHPSQALLDAFTIRKNRFRGNKWCKWWRRSSFQSCTFQCFTTIKTWSKGNVSCSTNFTSGRCGNLAMHSLI